MQTTMPGYNPQVKVLFAKISGFILLAITASVSFGQGGINPGDPGGGANTSNITITVVSSEYEEQGYDESWQDNHAVVTSMTSTLGAKANVRIADNVLSPIPLLANCKLKVKYRATYTGQKPTNAYALITGTVASSGNASGSLSAPKFGTTEQYGTWPGDQASIYDLKKMDFYSGIKKLNFPNDPLTPYVEFEVTGQGSVSVTAAGKQSHIELAVNCTPYTKGLEIKRDVEPTYELEYLLNVAQRKEVVNEYVNDKRFVVGYHFVAPIGYYVPPGTALPGASTNLLTASFLGLWDSGATDTWDPNGYYVPVGVHMFIKEASAEHMQDLRKNNSFDLLDIKVVGDDSWVPVTGGSAIANAHLFIHPPSGLNNEIDYDDVSTENSSSWFFTYQPQQTTWSLAAQIQNITSSSHEFTITGSLTIGVTQPLLDFLQIGLKADHNEKWGETRTKGVVVVGTSGGNIPENGTVEAWLETVTTNSNHLRQYDKYDIDGFSGQYSERTNFAQHFKYSVKSEVTYP